jgi:hypothetical protein
MENQNSNPTTNFSLPNRQDIDKGVQNLGDTLQSTSENINEQFSDFSKQATTGVGATAVFLQSNTIIAKFAFIILILVLFLILLNIGILILSRIFSHSENPYLIKGMIDGSNARSVAQDTEKGNAIPIYRSNNEDEGAEFTWSFWLYLSDLGNDPKKQKYQHIFSKGEGTFDKTTGIMSVNNSPGVYLEPNNNNLYIKLDTVDHTDSNNKIIVDNIPIKKWVHVAIRLENKVVDVYVNGVISNRLVLNNVIKQNYQDVHIAGNGGFNGKLSNLRYYAESLNMFEINSILQKGPNTKTVDTNLIAKNNYSYLSNYWYTSKY